MRIGRMACLISAVMILSPGWTKARPDGSGDEDDSILSKSWFQPEARASEEFLPGEAMDPFEAPEAGDPGFGPGFPWGEPRIRRHGLRVVGHGGLLDLLRIHRAEFDIRDEKLGRLKELGFKLEELEVKQGNAAAEHRLEMEKQLSDPEARDYAVIQTLMEEMSRIRIGTFIEEMKLRDQIRDVLTPEQWRAVHEAGRERMGKIRGLYPDPENRPSRLFPRFRRES